MRRQSKRSQMISYAKSLQSNFDNAVLTPQYFDIYVRRQNMKAIDRIDSCDLELGTLYYRVPDYGFVRVADLYNVKCVSYVQKQILVAYLDTIVRKQDGSGLNISIHLIGD